MAWTSSDLTTIETAIRTALTDGIASVSIGGQSVQTYTLESLQKLRAEMRAEIAGANPDARFGMRMLKTVPGGAG